MGIPVELRALTYGRTDRASTEASIAFLEQLWDYPAKEYTFMGVKSGNRWKDLYVKGDRASRIAEILDDYPPSKYDIYFCPNSFDRASRKTPYALPSAYAWCDIDANDVARYDPQPNILWETSPGRHQGLWIWRRKALAEAAEQYSKNIVYKDGGDQGGWSVTKMLRLPGTINHKTDYDRPVVTLRAFDPKPQRLPESLSVVRPTVQYREMFQGSVDVSGIDPQEIIERYRSRVSLFARALMTAKRIIYPDRSEAIFVITSELVRVGASNAEIASVLLINPHFVEKHGNNLAMAEREIVCIRAKVGDDQ